MAAMDSSTVRLTEAALKKLTVPQLKLMCKERRVVGYSKLAKDNLVQKLLSSQGASGLGSVISVTATSSQTPNVKDNVLSTNGLVNKESNCNRETRNTDEARTTLGDLSKDHGRPGSITGGRPTGDFQQTRLNGISSHETLLDIGNTCDSTLKRSSASTKEPPAPKKSRLDTQQLTSSVLYSEGISSTLSDLGSKKPGDSNVVASVKPTTAIPDVIKITNRRFKPLVPSSINSSIKDRSQMRPLIQVNSTNVVSVRKITDQSVGRMEHLDFAPEKPVSLTTILFPPSVAQRKHIPSLSLILSGISYEHLKTCALVSRAFRYAAYLSASHQLSRRFQGRRLQEIFCRYSSKITDMWPYLLLREREAISRRTTYERSFLSKTLNGIAGVALHLWHSPNHEKQITVALRFLTTRLFFLISTGHGHNEFNTPGKPGRVLDVQEVVKNEIWKITYSSSTGIQKFHVLEDTCEVIGESGYSSGGPIALTPHDIRNDWQAYIDEVSNRKDSCPGGGLSEHLQWSNHEEYDKGISKVWLKRIEAEGNVGVAKRTIARRYVLGCVVANSVSGPWRTANEMAQEFDGRGSVNPISKKQTKKLHLFLPTHHHIESVHFTSNSGYALHEALAVVQTPGREYFILRDNGMQVGCEEEGVALIWMKTLRCLSNGCVEP